MVLLKRVVLFLITNLAVVAVLSVALNLLRIFGIVPPGLSGYAPLLIMAVVMGFGGAFISLAMSRWIAKRATGAEVITTPRNPTEAWLVETVHEQARRAGIAMPEVAIFDSPDPNAFATGPSRNRSMVAVSTGLLNSMDRDEVEAVLGHEVAHVANGDMVTLTLIQGVVNTFVIFLARVIGDIVDRALFRKEEDEGPGLSYFAVVLVTELTLGIAASMIVAWFSRQREFRADRGGAELAGTRKMINALQRLRRSEPSHLPDSVAAFGISGSRLGGLKALFRTHPPLEERIERLQRELAPTRSAAFSA